MYYNFLSADCGGVRVHRSVAAGARVDQHHRRRHCGYKRLRGESGGVRLRDGMCVDSGDDLAGAVVVHGIEHVFHAHHQYVHRQSMQNFHFEQPLAHNLLQLAGRGLCVHCRC